MQNRPLAAATYVLTGMAIIGWIDQFVRVIAETSSLWSFHLMRTTMIWGLVLVWLGLSGGRLRVVNWRGLALRSGTMSIAMIIYFGALAFIPVAQAVAGLFTSPIWVLIFSVAFFGLRIGFWRVLAVVLGFAGIVLVLSPDPETLSPLVFMPVVAGAFYAVAVLGTRAWCPKDGALELSLGIFTAMAVWGGVVGVVLSLTAPDIPQGDAAFLYRGLVWPDAQALFWTFVQAIGSLIAVICLTRGYQLAEASYVTVFEYSLLIFSAVFGYMVWGDLVTPLGWLGFAMIVNAGMIIAWRARR